jgi:hypothetical protein
MTSGAGGKAEISPDFGPCLERAGAEMAAERRLVVEYDCDESVEINARQFVGCAAGVSSRDEESTHPG